MTLFLAFASADWAIAATLRRLFGPAALAREPLLPKTSWILRFAPATRAVAAALALGASLDLGPNTPRQEAVPQRHSWTFLDEKGLIRFISKQVQNGRKFRN